MTGSCAGSAFPALRMNKNQIAKAPVEMPVKTPSKKLIGSTAPGYIRSTPTMKEGFSLPEVKEEHGDEAARYPGTPALTTGLTPGGLEF